MRFDAESCGDRKASDPVGHAGFPGGDEIGQAQVRALHRFVRLLAEVVQADCLALVLDFNVIADARGGPEADHRLGLEPSLGDDPLKDSLGVPEQFRCLRANHGIGEDGRIMAMQFPGLEKTVSSRSPAAVLQVGCRRTR